MLRALSMTPGCSLRVSHNHSTACLVGPDALDVDLAFQFAPAGHCDMKQDDPIPRHLERKAGLIAAGRDFRRFSEDGAIPACDMSPSSVMCAPVTAFATESASRKVMTTGPIRAGSGEISCSIVTVCDKSDGLGHPFETAMVRANSSSFRNPFGINRPARRPYGPIRRYRPSSLVHSLVETCGSTCRSPWG
jgi:hypothetical protein